MVKVAVDQEEEEVKAEVVEAATLPHASVGSLRKATH